MKIIINCDDFGANPKVNDSIANLMAQRLVSSATLMMNAPSVEEAVSRIGQFKECSFGVHLNVTEFRPLSAHSGLIPILNDRGEFVGNSRRDPLRIPLTSAIREGIYAEWCAQIERALALGVPVSHLDSHHHVHTRLSLIGVLKKVMQKYGIRKVRMKPNLLEVPKSARKRLRVAKQYPWNVALRHFAHAQTTDRFASFSGFYHRLGAGLDWSGTMELMCHPGRDRYAEETELLRGPWKDQIVPRIALISYDHL